MAAPAQSDRPPIRLLHQMARSGGTLISRCLACMARIMLLSEVHSRATGFVNPLAQAQDWFGPFSPDMWVALQQRGSMPFADAVREIVTAAADRDQILVLREWSHLDFTGVPFVAVPPGHSLTAQDLDPSFDVVRCTTTRHPLDQYLSAAAVPSLRGRLDPDAYMRGYRSFAEMATRTGFVTYEAFCAEPLQVMEKVCATLGLPFDTTFMERQTNWTRITGDHPVAGSRAAGAPRMQSRRACAPALLERITVNEDYRASLDMLGYKHAA